MSEVQKIPKPQLRGLLKNYLRTHITIGIVAGVAASGLWYYFVSAPRKKAYAEFYKNYDGIKDWERMKACNVLPPWPQMERIED